MFKYQLIDSIKIIYRFTASYNYKTVNNVYTIRPPFKKEVLLYIILSENLPVILYYCAIAQTESGFNSIYPSLADMFSRYIGFVFSFTDTSLSSAQIISPFL